MKEVKRSKLAPMFSETINREYPIVILDDHKYLFVGIGWVDEGKASAEDKSKYPKAVD